MKTKSKKVISNAIIIFVAVITIIGLSDFIFLIKTNKPDTEKSSENVMEKVFIKTKDGVQIAANHFIVDRSRFIEPLGWIVLTHMMPATKESWTDFAEFLRKSGFEILAIDLRGHGESENGPTGFLKFSDEEHQKSINDLEVAFEFLADKKAVAEKTIFIGASIGASLSLQMIANPPAGGPEFKKAVLISPGLSYRGIKTEPMVKKLTAGQKVLFVSAEDDDNNSEQTKKLFDEISAPAEKKIEIYKIGGHGTDMFVFHPEIFDLIFNFIK